MSKILIFVLLLVAATIASAQNQYYVATTGSGTACTSATPCATINQAITTATIGSAGAQINVASGSYAGNVTVPSTKSGTSASVRMTLVSTTPYGAIISSPSGSAVTVQSNWTDIKNFEIKGTTLTSFGIIFYGTNGRAIGNKIHDIYGPTGCLNSGAAGIDGQNASTGTSVIGNYLYNIGVTGSCVNNIAIYLGSMNGVIDNNIVVGTPQTMAIENWHAAANMVISNNTVFNNGNFNGNGYIGGGILVGAGDSGVTTGNINTSVINNIVYSNGGVGIRIYGTVPGTSNVYSHNIVNSNGANYMNQTTITTAANFPCTGCLDVNPGFVNYQANGSGDYHPTSASPAVQGGTKIGAASPGCASNCAPATDFANQPQSTPNPVIGYLVPTGSVSGSIKLTPTSLGFGNSNVGVATAPQAITILNNGTVNVVINSALFTGANVGDFQVGGIGTCVLPNQSLAPNASCTVSAKFQPTSAGAKTANYSITDTAAGSPHIAPMTGTGTAPAVSLSVTTMAFGSVQLGATSAIQTSTLTNTGNGQLNISSLGLTGTDITQFSQSNTCGAVVAAGANCVISVTFKPTTLGVKSANISIADNAAGSSQTITLGGTGTGTPDPQMSPPSLTFGSQLVGTTSSSQPVTLTNNGNAPLTISSIGTSGDFSQTNNCPLAPNTLAAAPASPISCTINVKFSPGAPGNRSGTLTATSNAPSGTTTAALSGTGVQGAISLAPTSLTFAGQLVGTSSSSQAITITNSGTALVNISGVTLTGANPGDYGLSSSCGSSLAALASCTATITFTPTATGSRTATLSVADDAPNSPQTASLTGAGTAPAVTLTPSSVAFGNQITGSVSPATNIMLSNTGTGLLNISSIALSGTDPTQFTQSGNCGTTLAAGTNCTIAVRFAPTTPGSKSASLTVTDSATGSPHSSTLTGTGIAGTPVALLTPSSLTFPSTLLGISSATQTATLQNTGTADLHITSIAISGDYSQTNNCVSPLVAPTSCSIMVKFTPVFTGTRTGTLSVTDDGGGTQTVALSGLGANPSGGGGIAVISPSSLVFTSGQVVGTSSAVQDLTLMNQDLATMTVNSVTLGGSNPTDYSETNNCVPALGAGASCKVHVTFTPLAAGSRPATVVFTDSSAGSPQSIPVSGTGIAAFGVVNVVPTALNFGSAQSTTTTPAQTVTVKNVGTALLNISGITKTGTNPTEYTLTNPCGATLAINATCILSITFTPSTTGTRTANISIASDDPNSPTIVPMTGVGTPAPAPHVQLSASFLTFPLTQTGNTTPTQNVIVSNIGDATLTLSGITLGTPNATDYVLTNPCGASIAATASCTLQIAFRPIAGGTRTSSVSIADNASDTPQVISLTGDAFVGTPTADLSTSNITFVPNQVLLTTSGPRSILLTNNGIAALAITSVTASSDLSPGSTEFAQTNNCGSSVPAHGSCTMNATFTPQATGARTGKVTLLDNAINSPQVVILMGTGINPPPPPGNSATGMGGSAGAGGKIGQGVH